MSSNKKEKKINNKKEKENDDNNMNKRDMKLQAIILADTFRGFFNPMTWNMPTVLMPLINIPMIDYTIEFLALNNVEEVNFHI